MNHLYYTWCRAEHSLGGNSGWGIRALSPGFPEHEAHQLIPHANFQFLDTISPENSPVRLAYVKHPELGNILIHAVAIGQCPGQSRGGNYFVHCLTDLGQNFDGFQAILHWNSPGWVVEDFDSPAGPPSWNAPNMDFDSIEETARENLRNPEYYETTMYCLEAFLALDDTQKLYIAGPSEDISQLISAIGISLPREGRKGMTFTTYDNLNSPPDVKIMGCFFVDSNTEDFPPYHYQDGFYSVNTYYNKRSVAPPTSDFARGILPLLRDYGGKQVQTIHDFIERTGLYEPRDHSIIFALHPQPGNPIQLDPDSVHYVMGHWPIQFLDYLPESRREELLEQVRTNYHPWRDENSRDWILKILNNFEYLKAISQRSQLTQALLEDLFEKNELEASLGYLPKYESYIDENVPVQSRSRAVYGLGQFIGSETLPSIDDLQALEVLSSHCLMLANDINAIPSDNGNRVPVQLWFRLSWMCNNRGDLEKIFELFGSLTHGKQNFFERILLCYYYFPDHLKDKIVTFLRFADANKLTIPPDTLGKIFEENDELFFDVFNRLNQNPANLTQLFEQPNTSSFFSQFSGPNRSLRFKTIVQEEQITKDNFDHIRRVVKDNEVDQYLLYSHPLNSIFQSLYNEAVENLSLDDFLEKDSKIHHFCQRLKASGYITEESHPILRSLKVNALAQKDNNWAMVRDEQTMFSLINIYHSNRGEPRIEQFRRLYIEYIYTGIDHFSDLEKYLKRPPPDPTNPEHRDLNRDTKLDLLEQLMELIDKKPAEDPQRKKAIAAIWFYVAILLADGTTAESKSMNHPLNPAPLIDYRWIFWLKGKAKIPEDVGKATKPIFEMVIKKLLAQPQVVKAFVGVSLRNFVNKYISVLDKKFKNQMLSAFNQKAISDENEICFTGSLDRRPWWKKWWVWLLVLIVTIIVGLSLSFAVSMFGGKGTTDNNGTDNNASQTQDKIIELAIRKQIEKPTGDLTKADLDNVQVLTLIDSGLTDAGLKELAKLKQLKTLSLKNTKITDKGLKDLAKLKQLTFINLEDTKTTGKGRRELRKALPKCNVSHPR